MGEQDLRFRWILEGFPLLQQPAVSLRPCDVVPNLEANDQLTSAPPCLGETGPWRGSQESTASLNSNLAKFYLPMISVLSQIGQNFWSINKESHGQRFCETGVDLGWILTGFVFLSLPLGCSRLGCFVCLSHSVRRDYSGMYCELISLVKFDR